MNEEVIIRTLKHFYKKQLLLLASDETTSEDDAALNFFQSRSENSSRSQGDSTEAPLQQKQLLIRDSTQVMENNLCKLLRALHSMSDCNCDSSWKCSSTLDCACQAALSTEEEKDSSCKSYPNTNDSTHPEGIISESEDNRSSEIVNLSHANVLNCIETVMQWLEKQEECNSQTLLVLKNIHELAATKKYAELKLKAIVSFFEKQL